MDTVLGVDPGTLITGYGIIQGDLTVLDYGCIRPPAHLKLSDRYLIIFQSIRTLIQKFRPKKLAIESQYVKNNIQSALKLGRAQAAVILAAKLEGLDIYEYAPSKIKLAATGNGKASKAQVQGMMAHILKLNEIPPVEDTADALACAFCHLLASQKNLILYQEW